MLITLKRLYLYQKETITTKNKIMKNLQNTIETLITKIQNGTATSIDHKSYITAKNQLRALQN